MCYIFFIVEGKLARVRFTSWCNVVFGNELVLVPQEKITGVSFPSWCSEFLGNMVVLVM